jgi:hypothetical protein
LQSPPQPLSPIENEIPAYRAISSLAVFSLIFGIGAVFTFADIRFAVLAALAIVLGALALRRIRRFPDMLTGAGLARTGVALGLVFSLSATTFLFVRDFQVRHSASRFARGYARLLDSADIVGASWYRLPPGQRQADRKAQYDSLMANADFEMKARYLGPIVELQNQTSRPGASAEFVGLERAGFDGVTPYAFALVRIKPGPHDHDDHAGHDHAEGEDDDHDHAAPEEQFALLELRSDPEAGGFAWYVNELMFPYQRDSHELQPKPVDDGHGHAH